MFPGYKYFLQRKARSQALQVPRAQPWPFAIESTVGASWASLGLCHGKWNCTASPEGSAMESSFLPGTQVRHDLKNQKCPWSLPSCAFVRASQILANSKERLHTSQELGTMPSRRAEGSQLLQTADRYLRIQKAPRFSLSLFFFRDCC